MTDREIIESYHTYSKPRLAELLQAAGLDRVYFKAIGDSLFCSLDGEEVEVLDLIGGFGASLFGHNHPDLVAKAKQVLGDRRPFNCQGSIRPAAARLSEMLSTLAKSVSGRHYMVTLANSGTEAVEAAIKHAEMERRLSIDGIQRGLIEKSHRIRRDLRDSSAVVSEELLHHAGQHFGVASIEGLDELFFRNHREALNALEATPVFLAIEGAFHGKTSGAVQLTHRPEYKAPWRAIGPNTTFLPRWDVAALRRAVESSVVVFPDVKVVDGIVEFEERTFCNVAALFVEPILGEGGIHVAPREYLLACRELADEFGFPLILDEIQCGMGRTGTFFASEQSCVTGDYVTISKSLGAGLAKVSALLVDKKRYIEEFGVVHTSTFAEDDYSSEIALAGLKLLSANSGYLMTQCSKLGDRFLEKLSKVQSNYPEQIADVRGRGLMIGVELASLENSTSPMMRVLTNQELLGFVVSGWLLNECRIRVAPTVSSRATLRIEPSAYIEEAAMDRFCEALSGLCEVIRDGDAYRLLRYTVGKSGVAGRVPPEKSKVEPKPARVGYAKVGFLAHFLEPRDMASWDRSLSSFDDADCESFLDRTQGVLEPFVADTVEIESVVGTKAHCTVFAIPFTPAQVVRSMREGRGDWALNLVLQGVERARQAGCSVVGFGGYTSIVTQNCRLVVPSDVAVTTGNSLTSVAALDAMFLAAERLKIEHKVLGVVGAVGNIGQVLAEVCAQEVDEIVLVGSSRGRSRLLRAAHKLAGRIVARNQSAPRRRGIALSLHAAGLSRQNLGEFDPTRADSPIRIATDMKALVGCNLVLSATNSAKPVIYAEHIAAEGPVVVSDVAVPVDVDPDVASKRPNAVCLSGGVVRAPLGQTIEVAGIQLPSGQVYGCLGETLLMGLAGVGENLSYGNLDPLKIARVRELARQHGFKIEESQS